MTAASQCLVRVGPARNHGKVLLTAGPQGNPREFHLNAQPVSHCSQREISRVGSCTPPQVHVANRRTASPAPFSSSSCAISTCVSTSMHPPILGSGDAETNEKRQDLGSEGTFSAASPGTPLEADPRVSLLSFVTPEGSFPPRPQHGLTFCYQSGLQFRKQKGHPSMHCCDTFCLHHDFLWPLSPYVMVSPLNLELTVLSLQLRIFRSRKAMRHVNMA